MANLIDVLSNTGLRTGETLSRAEVHRQGKYHRAIHLYILNAKNEILLQKRALTVDNAPGVWTISALGHVDAGETSAATVKREVEEELGVNASQWKFDFLFSFLQEVDVSKTYIERQFSDVYLTRVDLDLTRVRLDAAEVAEVKFVPFERFLEMVSDPSSGLAPVYMEECRDLVYFLENSASR